MIRALRRTDLARAWARSGNSGPPLGGV